MTMGTGCAIVVFAKAPVAGYAKTRLAGALGAEGAARLAARLLDATTAEAMAAHVGPVEVCCAPDIDHVAFAALARRWPLALSGQGGGSLGDRLHRAFARALAGHRRAIVIGTDAPRLDAAYLRAAAACLDDDGGHDAVLGPAEDGGYTLIGLRAASPLLFDGIDWSTPRVLVQTRARIHRLGWRHAELATLADVDEPADLRHLPPAWVRSGDLGIPIDVVGATSAASAATEADTARGTPVAVQTRVVAATTTTATSAATKE